jgi:RES domain
VFERIAPPEAWEALIKLESLTNPRLRNEAGNISLVPIERRVNGPGASIVMAPFTHASTARPSRFSDGAYGVYYAGRKFATALAEVAFHMARFHAATDDPPLVGKYRSYKGKLNAVLHDVSGAHFAHLLNPDVTAWHQPQAVAKSLRGAGSNGLVYPSVRHEGGQCVAAFWPDVVGIPIEERHVDLKWDGKSVSKWFNEATSTWRTVPNTKG